MELEKIVIFQSQFILHSGSVAMPELRTNGQSNGRVFYVLIHHFSEQETNLRAVCAFWGNFVWTSIWLQYPWKIFPRGVCMHIHTHTHIYIYIYIYICIHTHTNLCMSVCVCVCLCACVYPRESCENFRAWEMWDSFTTRAWRDPRREDLAAPPTLPQPMCYHFRFRYLNFGICTAVGFSHCCIFLHEKRLSILLKL